MSRGFQSIRLECSLEAGIFSSFDIILEISTLFIPDNASNSTNLGVFFPFILPD